MTLADLLAALPPTGLDGMAFPQRLLGAFRRKSITFCTGQTDETTVVYWFQSKTFTLDLRLPDGAATPALDRQGWVGDTIWDDAARQLSWSINRSYQPRNQWPEPAALSFIGNSILEFAPSGAYVEDWRQQSSRGPLLGLRLVSLFDEYTGITHAMDGGLVVAGEHTAYAQSRLPVIDDALNGVQSLADALANSLVTHREIESYEVSVATAGPAITHGTQPERVGTPLAPGDFAIERDGAVVLSKADGGAAYRLRFLVDCFVPDFTFDSATPCTAEAGRWIEREHDHLMRNSAIAR